MITPAALRVFPETKQASVSLKVCPKQNKHGRLEIDVADRFGNRPVRMAFPTTERSARPTALSPSQLPNMNRSTGTR